MNDTQKAEIRQKAKESLEARCPFLHWNIYDDPPVELTAEEEKAAIEWAGVGATDLTQTESAMVIKCEMVFLPPEPPKKTLSILFYQDYEAWRDFAGSMPDILIDSIAQEIAEAIKK